MTAAAVSTASMWLVYVDDNGGQHHQPWQDLVEAGTLIDPDTGDDMTVVGWTTTEPQT